MNIAYKCDKSKEQLGLELVLGLELKEIEYKM